MDSGLKIKIKDFVIKWFLANSTLKAEELESSFNENYLEKGWIDSFKFISFISEIEQNFKIHFSNSDFQDRSFSTIEGLIKIINNIINGKV